MSKTAEPEQQPPLRPGQQERAETFLHRWSRRKREARAQEAAPPRDETRPIQPEPEPPPAPPKVLTDADMPPLESLDESSDFSMFLSAGVSEGLRRQALRKLFSLPGIGERYTLESEYYDCHGFEPLGNIVTHEMKEEMERMARKLKESVQEALTEDKPNAVAVPIEVKTPVAQPAPEHKVEPEAAAPAAASARAPAEDRTLRGHLRKKETLP